MVFPRRARLLAAMLSLCVVLAAARVEADAHGGIAALSLTAADGTMQTSTGVRLSISAVPGVPDRAVAMSGPVRARMGALRTCFSAAIQRAPRVFGRTDFEVEARGPATRVRLTHDDTGDAQLVSCMRKALAQATFAQVPRGSRAKVGVQLNNPLAARAQPRAEAPSGSVRMLEGGRAESEHGLLQGDIKVRLTGAASAVPAIARLQQGIASQVSGLLDCRRKAFRGGRREAHIAIPLRVRAGALAQGAPRSTMRRGAPECVSEWLDRLEVARMPDTELELAISFAP